MDLSFSQASPLRRIFDFFVFSSLYIALCAVLMIWQTNRLLIGQNPGFPLLGFVFSATICSYNFHWYLTPFSVSPSHRIAWAQQHKGWHLFLYFAGLAGCIIFFIPLREHWMALAFAAFLTFLYSAPKLPDHFFYELKRIAVGKTVFLAFVWTYVTAVLPMLIANKEWTNVFSWYALGRFGLIYAICIIFDYRDREDDKREGIRSMITLLNEKGIRILFLLSLLLSVISTIILVQWNFNAVTIASLLTPVVITAALYGYATTHFSDYLYYVILDGLMMLSALLMLLFRI